MSIEKKKEIKPVIGGGGDGSIFDATPEPESKDVSISCGPYLETRPAAGMSIGEVRKRFADALDIDKQAVAIVDGNDADENYVLKAGEALMFVKHAGEKGVVND